MAADLLQKAYDEYESAQDFTVAVEEEFAILDPETLSLTNRFEDLKAAAENRARVGSRRRVDRIGGRDQDRAVRDLR